MSSMGSEPAGLTVVLLDQRRRWQRHERVLVETYLSQEPALCNDPEAVLDLIYQEIVLREESGDGPQLDEYLQRFPQFAEQIGLQFQVHRVVETDPLTRVASVQTEAGFASYPSDDREKPSGATVIPGYELLGELGRGGMGVVYQARQLGLNRLVAVKMILGGLHVNPKVVARFRTEAEAVARLHHPNIVQIHAVGEQDGLPYFVLELVPGTSLQKRLASQPLAAPQAARLVETLAQAMQHAHTQGIVHRDLKPSNVLLAGSRDLPIDHTTPKITDFGLAKLLDAETGQTPAESCVGTPNYMAPEQAAGAGNAGPAVDLYSLGAILYELLAGRPPFAGGTVLETLEQVRSQEPVRPSRLQTGVPRDLETICLKCLEKEPEKRYVTAQDLADDLRRYLAGEPIQARPTRLRERVAKWAKRRPAVAVLVVCIALAVLGMLAAVPKYQRLADQAAHRSADETYHKFLRLYETALYQGHGIEALVQGGLLAGETSAINPQASADAAREALASVGIAIDSETAWAPDPKFAVVQKDEITEGAYTLLLILADAVAREPVPNQPNADRYRDALRILDRAAQLGLTTQAYHLRRASYLDELGDRRAAEEEYQRGVNREPERALDYFLSGYQSYERAELKKAEQALDMAVKLQPKHFWAQYYLALCHLQSGNWKAATARLTSCLGQQPALIWLYLLRGFAYQQLQEFLAAQADLQKALEFDPSEDARYCLLVSCGLLRFDQGDVAEAVADLTQAIALKPKQFHAYLSLARVYQKQKKYDRATQELERVVKLRPPDAVLAQCHGERARNLYLANQYEAAVQACDEALRIRSGQTVVYGFRGLALLQLKLFAPAAHSFDEYLKRGGEAVADIYRGRGLARVKLGDYLGARADYTRALELREGADLYNHRGWAYALADAWKPALDDFENAIRRNPQESEPYIGRGLARVMLGQYEPAVLDAQEALRRSPDTPEMMHNVACIFAQAVGILENDAKQSAPQTLAAKYREQSLEAVRKTLALLPPQERLAFWKDKILTDAALDPIRDCAEFKQIGKEHAVSTRQ
jgi:tetratricopeptide (TPR) repeat protein